MASPPPHPTRPVAVRVVCALLLLAAAVLLFDAILTATVAGAVHARLAELWHDKPSDPDRRSRMPGTLWPFVGTTLTGGIGLAVAFVVAAVGAARGWPWLRSAIGTIGPVIACCSTAGTCAFAVFSHGGELTDSRIDAAKGVVPLWIQVAWGIDGALILVVVVAAAVVVRLPSVATYFQPRREPPIAEGPENHGGQAT